VTWHLKAGIVEPEEMFIAKKRLGKHVSAAMNMHAAIEGLLAKGIFCWVRPEAI
jgi:hypothetical protein